MQSYSIHEAQTHLASLVAQAAQGTPFIIVQDDGKPLVKVAALETPVAPSPRRFGFLAGRIRTPDNFDRMDEDEIARLFGAE